MTRHLTMEDIDRFRRGEISGREVLDLSRHLDACTDCSALARERVGFDAAADVVRAELGIDDGESVHPNVAPRARHWKRMAAAAAVAAALIPAAIVMTRAPKSKPVERIVTSGPPPAKSPSYGVADWDSLVAEARRSGRVEVPKAIRELQRPKDVFRGTPAHPAVSLYPTGEAVEAQKPRFDWTGAPEGRYVVQVFAGQQQVAHSPVLSTITWTPDRPLQRGLTYAWQVRVVGQDVIIPSPPAPPALFRIVDEETASEAAEARRRFPGDHLLLGLLCARAGLRRCAADELAHHAADHLSDPSAQRLADSVREWQVP